MANDIERGSDEEVAAANLGFLSSDDVRTGFISGTSFENKPIQYSAVDGLAMFEGDICLGTVDEMERSVGLMSGATEQDREGVTHGVVIPGNQYRWPNAVMPYVIDSGLPNQTRVNDAIAHWQTRTNMRFVLRTAANAAQYPNFVRFFKGTGCWSQVGMRGGQQDISLADGCGVGATIHEIGHAFGLWHEQSREDRDTYVTINWANIEAGKEHNFNQHISDGDDVGSYDYGSIMHYSSHAFSKNGLPTIAPKQSGVTIGQQTALSAGDIAAVHHIYRTLHYNLTVTQVYATPHSQNAWAHFAGLGWRKVETNTADGSRNTFGLLAVSRAFGKPVHAVLDGNTVYSAYGN